MQDQGLDWGKCVWLCIDQAACQHRWLSFACNRKNKKSCKQKSAVYTLYVLL